MARALESLKFTIVRGSANTPDANQPLVLVENEVTVDGEYDHWADDTGVRYHYPNQYKNRVVTGRPFVYYKGTRRRDGRSGKPEYFGTGVVGRIWRDPDVPESAPKKNWKWHCEIEDYRALPASVLAKQGDEYIESIDRYLGWRTGVREISWEAFRRILSLGGGRLCLSLQALLGKRQIRVPGVDGKEPRSVGLLLKDAQIHAVIPDRLWHSRYGHCDGIGAPDIRNITGAVDI